MENRKKEFLLEFLVLLTITALYLAVEFRREILSLNQFEENLAASNQSTISKSMVNQPQLQNAVKVSVSNDPYDAWAQESLGIPAIRNYLTFHPEVSLVKVAIFDTGINITHEEFSGLNYHFNTQDSFCENNPSSDTDGHGTATAGLLIGLWHNALGSYGAGNFPLFVCKSTTSQQESLVSRLEYAVEWGAKVVLFNLEHMSLDSDDELYEAINQAVSSGVAVIVPSGNGYGDNLAETLEGHPAVFTVGAHDHFGLRRPYSNYESTPTLKQIDFLAPGGEIISPTSLDDGQINSYRWFGGTSSSGPLAAGALAILFSLKPDLSLVEAKTILCAGATNHDFDLSDGDSDGCGNLNLAKSLTHPLLGLNIATLPPHFTRVMLDWRPLSPGVPYQFDFDTLGEGNGVNYSLSNAPSGAQINPSSGVFSFMPPTESEAQVLPLTVRAIKNGLETSFQGKLLIGGFASLPFSDSFERKDLRQFSPWWHMQTNDSGRIRIDSKREFTEGNNRGYLELSRWANGDFAQGIAVADLVFDLTHASSNLAITFQYWVPSPNHVANLLLPNGPGALDLNDSANWGDGLAFSLDGVTWYRAADLSAATTDWLTQTINFNDLLSQFGLTLGERLYLRFANYGSELGGGANSDRLLIDSVTVSYTP